jgi:3-hydroxy acid dehydrogenase/malonic semialdehyde reductase
MRFDLVQYRIKVTNITPVAAQTEFSLFRFKCNSETADSIYEGYEPLVAQYITETILFVVTRPAHVTINDLTIIPTAQASASVLWK